MCKRDNPTGRSHAAIMASALVATILSGGCASTQPTPLANVIEAATLAERLDSQVGDHRIVVLDVRAADAYDAGHVAGAVRLDARQWKAESLSDETGLSHEPLWHGRIGSAGVSGRDPVVIYDDGRMTDAARIWFIFQHFGVPEVAVLNGGYPALEPFMKSSRISASTTPTRPTLLTYRPTDSSGALIGLAERQGVLRSLERREAQIADVRTPAEYAGIDLRNNARGGHLPTAINLPHKRLLDDQGRLRSPQQLAEIFEEAGLKRGQPIIAHCNSGGRSSLAALAAERAGYGPVLNYYLSFGDWAADATCPVEQSVK